jgi:four helix bundle protein
MRNFRELRVWQRAHQLTLDVYEATASFPKQEVYGLTSQTRRAAVSIEANLAEGCGRRSDGELHRYVQMAMGSASELDCHLFIARDLGFLTAAAYNRLTASLSEVRRMLTAFIQRLEPDRQQNQSLAARATK